MKLESSITADIYSSSEGITLLSVTDISSRGASNEIYSWLAVFVLVAESSSLLFSNWHLGLLDRGYVNCSISVSNASGKDSSSVATISSSFKNYSSTLSQSSELDSSSNTSVFERDSFNVIDISSKLLSSFNCMLDSESLDDSSLSDGSSTRPAHSLYFVSSNYWVSNWNGSAYSSYDYFSSPIDWLS